MTVQAVKPVECIVTSGTAKAIQAAFDLAVKNGKSSYLGSVGGDTAQSDQTKRVVGQVQLFWRKDKSFHAVGKNGYDVVVKASGAQDAIMKTRQLLKTDKELGAQAYEIGKNCVKYAPISKVGRFIAIEELKPSFFKVLDSDDKPYYVAFYKASDKWAIGTENGKATVFGSKLSDSIWNRNAMALKLINADRNIFQQAGKAFFLRNVKKYSEEDVKSAQGVVTKVTTPTKSPAPTAAKPPFIAKPSYAKTAANYVYVPSTEVKPLDDNFALSKDVSGKLRAIRVFSYGKENFAVPTADGRLIGLKTTSDLENPDISARAEIAEILKKNEIKLATEYYVPKK